MSKLTDFVADLPDRTPGEKLRWLAELRLEQWKREVLQRQVGAGERFGADLLALVRPYVRDDSVAEYLAFMWQVALVQDTNVQLMYPLTVTGVQFKRGRKKGAIGPVRAWLRKYMTKHPEATTAQAWAALAKRPPKIMTVFDNRLGRYIETDDHPDTSYRQFANLVSLERPKK